MFDRRWLSGPRTVAIADCVHYCAFHYGREEFNPYENYIVGLARGIPVRDLRDRFVDFIRYYRPRDLGQALGVETERPVPLWWLPWKSWRKLWHPTGWRNSPDEVVDILTYFSDAGVRRSRIREEFYWLENAWESIRTEGYSPERYSFITVARMQGTKAQRYIVVDGNHRLGALAALGHKDVLVKELQFSAAHRARASLWPLVISGHVSRKDAMAIFDAYFRGNRNPYRDCMPARIIPD